MDEIISFIMTTSAEGIYTNIFLSLCSTAQTLTQSQLKFYIYNHALSILLHQHIYITSTNLYIDVEVIYIDAQQH